MKKQYTLYCFLQTDGADALRTSPQLTLLLNGSSQPAPQPAGWGALSSARASSPLRPPCAPSAPPRPRPRPGYRTPGGLGRGIRKRPIDFMTCVELFILTVRGTVKTEPLGGGV